jgi:hypothetical protein
MARPYTAYRESVDAKRDRIAARREVDLWTSGLPHDPERAWDEQTREQDRNFIRHMRRVYPELYTGDWSI